MEKRINEINEAFEHQRFEECLSMIEQTVKKFNKPDKKKQQITPKDSKEIQLFKIGCLLSLGKYHQADAIYKEFLEPGALEVFGEQFVLLLTSISEMFGENRQKKMLELLQKRERSKKEGVFKYYLSARMFSDLSKLLLKQFTTSANISILMGQVYCEYLQCLQRCNMIEFKRDGWYKHDQRLKMGLKMVNMFLIKCDERIEANRALHQKSIASNVIKDRELIEKQFKLSLKLSEKSKQLKLRMAINEGRVSDAIKMFQSQKNSIKFPFVFIRSILKLKNISEDKKIIDKFYVKQMSLTFRKNLDFNQYTPWYDYYNQFLWTMVREAEAETPDLKKSLQLKEEGIDWQQLYLFPSSKPREVIPLYFNSLASQYKRLVDSSEPDFQKSKKSDYYRICLKGLLLQLIQICSYFGLHQAMIRYLSEYVKHFGNTLTFAEQMKDYWQVLISKDILRVGQEVKTDSDLIREINFLKIKIQLESKEISMEGFMKNYEILKQMYTKRVKEIESNRKLEKGERYISDQFQLIIADYARAFTETCQTDQPVLQVASILVNELQAAISVSPYNADIKLRLMYFCYLLNHHERVKDVFFTNDIKSVQWQTLGYWFIRSGIQFSINEHDDQYLGKMVKSYQENSRQTTQYAFKAIKGGQYQRVDEYLCYRSCLLNSYNSIVMLYLLYQRHRFENHSEYYLAKINQRINQFRNGERELTFNADYKVMRNHLFEESQFANFYGVFNSYQYLQLEVQLALHEHALIGELQGKKVGEIMKEVMEISKLEEFLNGFEVAKCFDYSKYTFQEGAPRIQLERTKYSMMRTSNYLQNCKMVNQVRIAVIFLVSELNRYLQSQQVNKEAVSQIKQKVKKTLNDLTNSFSQMSYLSQIHSLTMIRRNLLESYNLLAIIRELVSKTKKLKFAKELVYSYTDQCLEAIKERILNMRWSPKKENSESKLILARDQQLQKQLGLDHTQFNRLTSKYQSLYKL